MKDHLINLRAWEAAALNEGRATALVRVCKPQPVRGFAPESPPVLGRITSPHPKRGRFGVFLRRGLDTGFPEFDLLPCPFGAPGDVILGRETWGLCAFFDDTDWCGFSIANESEDTIRTNFRVEYASDFGSAEECAWRSPVTMPRWAIRARHTNAGVRCMRVQELTEQDARDLGFFAYSWADDNISSRIQYVEQFTKDHGPGAWSANPWVFFARLAPCAQ